MSKIDKNSILLSIIIPVYNVEQYLRICIDSVMSQFRDDIEVIIVDDGSKDSSGKICDDYKLKYGSKINVIHQKNGGLSVARNTGIENAHGEYLYFLDSDDFISDKFIETVYRHLKKRKYDIVEFNSYWLTNDKKISLKTTNRFVEHSRLEMIDTLIKNEVGCQIWLRIYRSKLFRDIRFPLGRNYEDIATYYRLLLLSKNNLIIDSQLHVYNLLNNSSITQKANLKNLSDMFTAINEMYDGLQVFVEESSINALSLEYYKRSIYIYILLKMYRADLKNNDIYKQIVVYLRENNDYNYIKYKNYNLKRLFGYKLLRLLHKF